MRNVSLAIVLFCGMVAVGCGSREMSQQVQSPSENDAPRDTFRNVQSPLVVQPNDSSPRAPVTGIGSSNEEPRDMTLPPLESPQFEAFESASPLSGAEGGSLTSRSLSGDSVDEPSSLRLSPPRFSAVPNMLSEDPVGSTPDPAAATPRMLTEDLPLHSDEVGQPEADRLTVSENSRALTETDRGEHSVVQVFYGTDRQATSLAGLGAVDIRQFRDPVIVVIVAIVLGLVLRLRCRRRLAATVLTLGCAVAGVMAAPGVVDLLETTGDGKVVLRYGAERGSLQLGVCQVSIPKDHRVGEVESPSILRLEVRADKDKHVVLLDVEAKPDDEFFEQLHDCVAKSDRKEAFVFIHGYNVSFENAARRTAQIAHDLRFNGAPIFYSWPSQASVLKYTIDENNVTWTVPHLKQFLVDVARRSGAESIHLVAHSMGNRALTTALRELTYELEGETRLFNQVVLAAPDIDADVFKRDIAPAIQKTANRVTLYASSNDQALIASKKVHGYARAGDSGAGLVVIPGVETVDVSAIDTSLLGHSYYGDSDTIISDLYHLLHEKLSASRRSWLRPMPRDGLTYWVFHATQTEVATPSDASPFR